LDPNTKDQVEKSDTQPFPDVAEDAAEANPSHEIVGFFAKYEKVFTGTGVIVAAVAVLVAGFSAYVAWASLRQGGSAGTSSGGIVEPPPSRAVRVVARAKLPGIDFWSGKLRILPRHGRVRFKIRVENTGSERLTGLVAEAELAEPLTVVPGKCWLRGKQCPGSLLEAGVPLPDLEPGKWATVVFSANVPSSIYGATFSARLRVTSDQKGDSDTAEIVVSATDAEEKVRPFVREVEAELSTGGKAAMVAKRSKRLLLGQWPTVTLEHPHRFGQIKQFRDEIEARRIRVDDLNFERWLQGQVVSLRGVVLGRPVNDQPDDEDVVRQRVELGTPGGSTRLRCYIPRKPDHLFGRGDELEVKAVIVAWGPEGSSNADLTVAICPAARAVRRSRRP
jgi:hypothetical protein